MPKINLTTSYILARRYRVPRRRMNYEKDTVFYISKEHQDAIYYVQEVDKRTKAVKWTKHRRRAIRFRTQQAVYQYVHAYMNDRKDIYLVNGAEEG